MQSSTGQYSTQAGEPAHPVQHSVITANSFGFFFRGVARPFDFGSNLSSSGTIPTALVAPGAAGMRNYSPKRPTAETESPPPVHRRHCLVMLVLLVFFMLVTPFPILFLAF